MRAGRGGAHDAGMTNSDATGGNDGRAATRRPPPRLLHWMRVVGAFYVVQFVMMAIVRAPIRAFGPEGALEKADAGDPLAAFLVDTWTTFGLEVGAVGATLLVATRRAELAKGAIWTVLAIEVGRGILLDTYMITRGMNVAGYLVWLVIHSVVIATGLLALRTDRVGQDVPVTGSKATPAAQST